MILVDPSPIFSKIYPSLTWKKEPEERVVYLTFDDGPHPRITLEVLRILDEFNLKATFFCIGNNMQKYPEIVTKTLDLGHTIGNHTLNHASGFKTTTASYLQEVESWSREFRTQLFRPPYGRITRSQIRALEMDYEIIMWSLLSWDFKKSLKTTKILRQLKKGTRPGAIVVFHDSEKAEKNMMAILPEYCQFLVDQGYTSQSL